MKIMNIINSLGLLRKNIHLYKHVISFNKILGKNYGSIDRELFNTAIESLPENIKIDIGFWEIISKLNGLKMKEAESKGSLARNYSSVMYENQLNEEIAYYFKNNNNIKKDNEVQFTFLILDMLKMKSSLSITRLLNNDLILENKDLFDHFLGTIKSNPKVMDDISSRMKNKREVALTYVKYESRPYLTFENFNGDFEIMSHLIKKHPRFIQEASDDIKSNKEIALLAIKDNLHLMADLNESLLKDKDFAWEALNISSHAYLYLDKGIKNDRKLALKALKGEPNFLIDMDENLKNDPELAKVAVSKKGVLLEKLNEDLRNNIQLVKLAVANDGAAYMFIGDKLKSNKDLLLSAIRQDYYKLGKMHSYIVNSNYSDDKNVMWYLTKKYRTNLFACVGDLINDKEFVLKYMKRYDVYVRVSDNLRRDPEIINLALKKSWENLRYIPQLENENEYLEIIDQAFKKNPKNIGYVLKKIIDGEISLEKVLEKNSEIGVYLANNLREVVYPNVNRRFINEDFYITLLQKTKMREVYTNADVSIKNNLEVIKELVKIDIRNFIHVPKKILYNVDFLKDYRNLIADVKEDLSEIYHIIEPFIREDLLNEELKKIDSSKEGSSKRRKI